MVNNEDFQEIYTTVADQTAQYPIPFLYFFNPADGKPELTVYLNDNELEYQNDYTLSPSGLQLVVAPEAGQQLTITRAPTFEQLTDFQTGIIDPEQIENSFDRSVMRDIFVRGAVDSLGEQIESEFDSLAPVAWSGSYNDLTDVPGGLTQVQSDWNQTDNTQPDYIKNKPTIPAAQVQSDWNQSNSASVDYIKNKPTIPDAQVQSEWNQTDSTKPDYIKNKPAEPAAQVQSDWNQSDVSKPDYIKNKPTIPVVPTIGDGTITINQGGALKGTFSVNQTGNTTIYLDSGGGGGGGGAVESVNGYTGAVFLTAADVNALPDTTVIPAAQIQSDWNQSDVTSLDYIKNKPSIPAGQIQSDWNQSDNTKLDYIKNKPSIPAAQIQSDWSQSDVTSLDYIKNKPTNLVSTNTAQTISGIKTFTGDIVLSDTTSIKNSTSGTNTTLLYKDSTGAHVGAITTSLKLHGSDTRPTYNGNNLALYSDITAGTLPSQTGNSGKFLTTNGTDASWATINAIQNEATGSGSIAIGGATATLGGAVSIGNTASAASQGVAIGSSANAKTNGVSIGYYSTAQAQGVAIGVYSSLSTGATHSTAVGYYAQAYAKGAIQLGYGTNSTAGTFNVGLTTDGTTWNNYTLLGASGTIPAARMASVPVSDGTYVLQLTVTSGVPTLSWVSYNSNSSSYTYPAN